MPDDLPHIVSQCTVCKKRYASTFEAGQKPAETDLLNLGDSWISLEITDEEATALVLMGVPQRSVLCRDCTQHITESVSRGVCPKCGKRVHASGHR